MKSELFATVLEILAKAFVFVVLSAAAVLLVMTILGKVTP